MQRKKKIQGESRFRDNHSVMHHLSTERSLKEGARKALTNNVHEVFKILTINTERLWKKKKKSPE